MNNYIKIPFKNSETGYTIEQAININERITNLKSVISQNILTEFNLDYNEFDILDNEIIKLNDNDTSTLTNKYKNSIKYMCFYIKPNISQYTECPICIEDICLTNVRKLQCNHILCIPCYDKWNQSCISQSLNTTCPLCRTEY